MTENKIDKSSLLQGEPQNGTDDVLLKAAEKLSANQTNNRRFYCDALDDDDVNQVVTDVAPHVVTLIGFINFGKSTFVSSLYHHLMVNGSIGDYTFYDSDTYSGFERRAYIRNAKLSPKTRSLRTRESEGHLPSPHVKNKEQHVELVLSDRSGETYGKDYINDEALIRADKGLRNSKHLVFFIDASVLVNLSERLPFNGAFKKLLSRMSSADIFDGHLTIAIIFNKMDLIEETDQDEFCKQSEKTLKNLEEEAKQKINKIFTISSFKVNDNRELEKVFEYLVNCCDCKKTCLSGIDWVSKILNS